MRTDSAAGAAVGVRLGHERRIEVDVEVTHRWRATLDFGDHVEPVARQRRREITRRGRAGEVVVGHRRLRIGPVRGHDVVEIRGHGGAKQPYGTSPISAVVVVDSSVGSTQLLTSSGIVSLPTVHGERLPARRAATQRPVRVARLRRWRSDSTDSTRQPQLPMQVDSHVGLRRSPHDALLVDLLECHQHDQVGVAAQRAAGRARSTTTRSSRRRVRTRSCSVLVSVEPRNTADGVVWAKSGARHARSAVATAEHLGQRPRAVLGPDCIVIVATDPLTMRSTRIVAPGMAPSSLITAPDTVACPGPNTTLVVGDPCRARP